MTLDIVPGTYVSERLAHYTILERVGAGGMGVVYRARDDRLHREVALKLLPPALVADDEARRRLEREARALSRLNHPNIATIHALEVDGTTDFIVLEWVPGQTLDARIASGALEEVDVIRIGIQVAEALVAAHEAGVAHRDLKPANLRVTPHGELKVLDFGLARHTRMDTSISSTMAGHDTTAGTLAYMPPEAFHGQAGDARGDLYSLGVVLYELATGRRPFVGDTTPQVIHAILHHTVVPPRAANAAISPGLQAIILRLLQRDPAQRYESARALQRDLVALRDRGAAGTDARRPSIAVLPFVNLSGDPSQNYFADGMTEALIGDLARLRELRVISRTSVMRYKGVQRPIADIAAELNVEAVLEGSVLRDGDRVRVSVQLIEAHSDTNLWAERYDRAMQDILGLQSDVADSVAREIRGALLAGAPVAAPAPAFHGPGPAAPAARRVDPAAYDAYLRGRHQLNRRSEESMYRSVALFHTAIERDPGYALAHAGMAEAFAVLGYYEYAAAAESFPVARASARRALEIEPHLAQAHATLAYIALHYDWDWSEAERGFRQAIELGPNEVLTRTWYVNLLGAEGRFDEVREQLQRGLELDPLSMILHVVAGWTNFFEHRYLDALASLDRALVPEPTFAFALVWRGWTLARLGRAAEAAAALSAAAGAINYPPASLECQALAHAFAGRAAEASTTLQSLVALRGERNVSALAIASCYAALENHPRALDWLETARDERSPWFGYLKVDGRFEALRGDPRFEALQALVGSGGPG